LTMAIPSFFKQNMPRGFNFIPRHWDPAKEAREERVRRIKRELGIVEEGEKYVPYLSKGKMTNYFKQKGRRVKSYTSIRLIVIVLILMLISYFFFYF